MLTVYAGGDASGLLGPRHAPIPTDPVVPGRGVLRRLALASWRTHTLLADQKPDLMLTDGDQTVWAAARRRKIPTIAIGHDLVFFACDLGRELPRRRLWHQRANCVLPGLLAAHRIAVHFLPAKATRSGVTVARPEPEVDAREASDQGHYVAYFRDPNGRTWLERAASQGARVLAYGAGASAAGVEGRSTSREDFLRQLTGCRGVIASAGSNLLAECVLLRKPILALYEERDHEQALNALLAERAGVAMARPIHTATRGDVATFLRRAECGDFAQVDLARALPPVNRAVTDAVTRLLCGTTKE